MWCVDTQNIYDNGPQIGIPAPQAPWATPITEMRRFFLSAAAKPQAWGVDAGDCPDFRGTVDVVMRNALDRRENGTVPLVPREGDRSMFSAHRLFAKHDRTPKNGPVPDHRREKGTGPCFRLTVYSQNTIVRRKMDQSPTMALMVTWRSNYFNERSGTTGCCRPCYPRSWQIFTWD